MLRLLQDNAQDHKLTVIATWAGRLRTSRIALLATKEGFMRTTRLTYNFMD